MRVVDEDTGVARDALVVGGGAGGELDDVGRDIRGLRRAGVWLTNKQEVEKSRKKIGELSRPAQSEPNHSTPRAASDRGINLEHVLEDVAQRALKLTDDLTVKNAHAANSEKYCGINLSAV